MICLKSRVILLCDMLKLSNFTVNYVHYGGGTYALCLFIYVIQTVIILGVQRIRNSGKHLLLMPR